MRMTPPPSHVNPDHVELVVLGGDEVGDLQTALVLLCAVQHSVQQEHHDGQAHLPQ